MKTTISAPWADCIDTVTYRNDLSSWYSEYPELPYNFFKLPDYYNFDLSEMQQNVRTLLAKYPTIPISTNDRGKKYNKYRGLGFFSRKNSNAPLEDHFTRRDTTRGVVYKEDLQLSDTLLDLYENDFVEPTEILSNYFSEVFNKFKGKISKASLLDLKSRGYLGSHVDFPYYKTIRLHACIFGAENAWYEVNGEKIQFPADGSWYFIDTGKYHSVWNTGPADRLTININISDILEDPLHLATQLRL